MNEPRLRFKADDESQFPDWEEKKFANLYRKNVEKNVNLEFDSSKTISIASMQFNEKGNGASEDSLSSYKVLRLGDIAFEGHENKEYSHGRFVLNDIGDGIMSPRFSCMRPVCTQVDGFWKYYIHSERVMKNILVRSTKKGTMMHELVIPDFLKQSIMVPSLPEQQKIAEFLSTIDTVIKKQKETVSVWEERKKGVMQKLFSQEVRFKADDGSEFPEWEEKSYLSICNVFADGDWIESKDQSDSGIRLIQTGNIGNGVFIDKDDKKKYISKETFDRLKCNEVFEGDILISRLPSPAGRACIVPKLNERMITAVDCTIVRTDKSIILHDYCVQFMQSSKHFYYVASMMAGGTRQRISRKNLEDELISVPCLEEQQKIADCLSSLDEVIEKQKATLAAWEELKKGLLQQMFV